MATPETTLRSWGDIQSLVAGKAPDTTPHTMNRKRVETGIDRQLQEALRVLDSLGVEEILSLIKRDSWREGVVLPVDRKINGPRDRYDAQGFELLSAPIDIVSVRNDQGNMAIKREPRNASLKVVIYPVSADKRAQNLVIRQTYLFDLRQEEALTPPVEDHIQGRGFEDGLWEALHFQRFLSDQNGKFVHINPYTPDAQMSFYKTMVNLDQQRHDLQSSPKQIRKWSAGLITQVSPL